MATNYAPIFRRLRLQAGYSQKEEAKKLSELGVEINNAHVSRWESGANNPNIEQLLAICQLYDIRNIRDVFGDVVMSALTRDLNDQGVEKILEYHDLLIEDSRYTINPGNYGPNTFAQNFADDDEGGIFGTDEDEFTKRTVGVFDLGREDPTTSLAKETTEVPPGLPDNVSFAVIARDNSMSPQIEYGDLVFIVEGHRPRSGDTVLARYNGMLMLRTYVRENKNDWFMARNSAYREIRLTPNDQVAVLGIVVGREGRNEV